MREVFINLADFVIRWGVRAREGEYMPRAGHDVVPTTSGTECYNICIRLFLMQSDSASRKRFFSTGLFQFDSSGSSSYRQSS